MEHFQGNADSPVCVVYDTTYSLGDFYVSPFILKNTPWIPLDFLVNDKKLKESSSICRTELKFGMENVYHTYITGWELALMESLEHFFNLQVLDCWNHLERETGEREFKELRKLSADPSEIEINLS